MKRLSIIFLVVCSLGLFRAQASVWEDEQGWTMQREREFSAWMESDQVHEYMFVNPASRYYGLDFDCADAAYAFRAIFAYEKKLPFAIANPSGSRGNTPTLNNRSSNWDHFPAGLPRLFAMLTEISLSVGTDNLAYMDTYPVALQAIVPGTVFVSRIKVADDYFVKHALNIKSINPIGTFDLIYSSENIQAMKAPMQRRKDKTIDVLPVDPFGFRNFRWPEHIGRKIKTLPEELRPSFEQFALADTLGLAGFIDLVKRTLAKVEENDDQRMQRVFNSLCIEARARVEVVNQALHRLEEIGHRCMDFRDYDNFSTPARDASLKESFLTLQRNYYEIRDREGLGNVDEKLVEFAEIILEGRMREDESLLEWCSINYRQGQAMDLAELWRRIYFEKISSHPNDSVGIRWGEDGEMTSCKRWY